MSHTFVRTPKHGKQYSHIIKHNIEVLGQSRVWYNILRPKWIFILIDFTVSIKIFLISFNNWNILFAFIFSAVSIKQYKDVVIIKETHFVDLDKIKL